MRLIITLLGLVATLGLFAQNDRPVILPEGLDRVQLIELPAPDNNELLLEELALRAPGRAPRFAYTHEVDIRPETHGSWDVLRDGTQRWRLRLRSEGAYSLNLGFMEYVLPEGASLRLYDPLQKTEIGPFTAADNDAHRQLWTPMQDGDEMVLELRLPAAQRSNYHLRLTSVNHDFLDFSAVASGSCNLDVICGAEDGFGIVDLYRDIIQSVAVYSTGGSTFCTGFLVNNTAQDCRPFFMTADHCGIGANNAASLVVFWNYQQSFCRQPNSPESGGVGDGVLTDFNTGSTFRAAWSQSDMTLVELDDPVSETANAFFAGWDATPRTHRDTIIAIHHPRTDEKRISFEFDSTYLGAWGQGANPVPNGTHLIVPDWDIGTTEGGSSGSPLYNRNKRVIGQLHGGGAACGNDLYDSYGRFAVSWTGGGTPATSLQPWLSPNNPDLLVLDGRSQAACGFNVLAVEPFKEICPGDTATYQLVITESWENTVTVSLTHPAEVVSFPATLTGEPGDTISFQVTTAAGTDGGTYEVTYSATDGQQSIDNMVSLLVAPIFATAPAAVTPADASTNQVLDVQISWSDFGETARYDFEFGTMADLMNPDLSFANLEASEFFVENLMNSTTYYWRVRASNNCGTSPWSAIYSFSTGAFICETYTSTDVPLAISPSSANEVTSNLVVDVDGGLSFVKSVQLTIDHTYVGDLDAVLVAPSGSSALLFDRPGFPASNFGCNGDNLVLTFSDQADNTADELESTCNNNPAISGEFQSIDPLSGFAGENNSGTWQMVVTDHFDQDGGALIRWSIEGCRVVPEAPTLTLLEDLQPACLADTITASLLMGTGFTGMVDLTFLGLPAGATVDGADQSIMPGASTELSFSGFPEAGEYPVEVIANAANDSDTIKLDLVWLASPEMPVLAGPADGTSDLSTDQAIMFDWADLDGNAVISIATDSSFQNVAFTQPVANSNLVLDGADFEPGVTYYWQVENTNDCGTATSEVFSFIAYAPLSISLTPEDALLCQGEQIELGIEVGTGYPNAVGITVNINPNAVFGQTFNADPAAVAPGDVLELAIVDDAQAMPGQYTVYVTAADNNNTVLDSLTFELLGLPAAPDLLTPEDQSSLFDTEVSFSWTAVPNANTYDLEIARDPEFTDMIASFTTDQTGYVWNAGLEPVEGYWRVRTSDPACTGGYGDTFFFATSPDATYEWAGNQLTIAPNPARDEVFIRLDQPTDAPVSVALLAVNGQQLKTYLLPVATQQYRLDVSALPAGVYLLRLQQGDQQLTERVVKY